MRVPKVHVCFHRKTSFYMKPPSCATSPPAVDGAHWNTMIQMYWNCVICRTGYASISHEGDATVGGMPEYPRECQSF